jgi:hypothetical protein
MAGRGTKAKRWVLLSLGLILLALFAIPTISWIRLPRYQGKTLVFWWNEYVECERMPRVMVARPTLSYAPDTFEARFHRLTNAMAAFRTNDQRVAEFLLPKLNPGRLQGLAYTNWTRLPAGWQERLRAWEPLDPQQQRWTAESLLRQNSKAIGAAKSELLKLVIETGTDPQTRGIAFSLLSMSRGDFSDSASALVSLLKSTDTMHASWAAARLAGMGAAVRQYAPDVRAAIRQKRIAASTGIKCLLAMGEPVWSALPALNDELSSTNTVPLAALACVPQLGENRKYLITGLSNILHHPDERFVAGAMKVFHGMGEDARPLGPAFLEALNNPWYFLRAESVKALESLGGAEFQAAEPKLLSMETDPHPDVSNAVHHALITLGRRARD